MRQLLVSVLEVFEVAIVALLAVFLIRTFLVQPFLVSGASMAPNFENSDYLLVDELTYRLRAPERGEVVVFRYPNDESTYFIKRVIGLPGERAEIENGGVKIFNEEYPRGQTIPEDYLPSGQTTVVRSGGQSSFDLGEDEYLVLGDNRSYSYDSRDWGVLRAKEVVGLVRLRLWPPAGLTVFAAPRYFYQ